LIVLNFRRKI